MSRRMMLGFVAFSLCGVVAARAQDTSFDYDGDYDVDLADMAAFEQCVGMNGDADCLAAFDMDGDGDIDLDDYAMFLLKLAGPNVPLYMAHVPAGEYAMGDHYDDMPDALPVHAVSIDAFYLDLYEVSNAHYRDGLNWAFAQGLIDNPDDHNGVVYSAGGGVPFCDTTTSSPLSRITWDGAAFGVVTDKDNHPMVRVSWYGAAAYTNWRSTMHGRDVCYDVSTWACVFAANGYRLATEAEWEKAMRGGEHDPYYRFPWGNTVNGWNANYALSGDPFETGAEPWTTPRGYYDGGQTPAGPDMANGYGLYDTAGNAREWCNDWYEAEYYLFTPYDNPAGPAEGAARVLRGGSWGHNDLATRIADRNSSSPLTRSSYYGFRLARDSE